MKKTAYHYTSYENWLSIKENGFQPYLIDKPELWNYFPGGVIGIWLWPKKLSLVENFGSIIYQVAHRNSSHIVRLKVRYNPKHVVCPAMELLHGGTIEKFNYHVNTPALIVLEGIRAEDVELEVEYNLPELLK